MPKNGIRGTTTPKKRKRKEPTEDRARFLVDQCPHKITGIINIPGLQLQPPEHESNLERIAILLLALCADFVAISSQPVKIEFQRADGKTGRYTVDLLGTKANGEKLRIEVKPLKAALADEMAEKLLCVARHFARESQSFDILTDDIILQDPRKSTAIRLRGFLTQTVPPEIKAKIELALADGARTIRDLLQHFGCNDFWSHILALIAQRHLCIAWNEHCDKEMRVSLPNHPFPHLSYAALTASSRFRPLVQELAMGRRPTNRQLLAAALAEDRTIPIPDAFSAVGVLPRRGMQVDRTLGSGRTGNARCDEAEEIDQSGDEYRSAEELQ